MVEFLKFEYLQVKGDPHRLREIWATGIVWKEEGVGSLLPGRVPTPFKNTKGQVANEGISHIRRRYSVYRNQYWFYKIDHQ